MDRWHQIPQRGKVCKCIILAASPVLCPEAPKRLGFGRHQTLRKAGVRRGAENRDWSENVCTYRWNP